MNVEQVFLGVLEESVTVDAGRMDAVEQFWSDDSDNDLFIEDVRLGSKLSMTQDITFGLRDVDTDAGLYAAFDTNSLTNAGTTRADSQLLIRIADVSTETPETPLANVDMELGFVLGDQTFSLEGVRSTDGSYAGLVEALKAKLDAAGLGDIEVTLGEAYNQVSVANNTVNLPFTANQILLKDPDGEEFGQVSFEQSAIESVADGFLVAGNAEPFDPATSTTLIETNVILDNAGRGSTAGEVIIGGMSNSDVAIEKLNLRVDRDSKVSNVSSVVEAADNTASTSDATNFTNRVAFKAIELTSGDAKGDLSISNIYDTQLFDGSAFEGQNLAVGANIETTEALYNYTGASSSNDTFVINYDVDAVDSHHSGITVSTSAGNDTVTLNQADVEDGADESYAEFENQVDLMNIQVNTGAGDDTVNIGDNLSATQVIAGSGADYIQVSDSTHTNDRGLAGFEGTSNTAGNPDNTAQWILNATEATNIPPVNTQIEVGAGNQQFQVFKMQVQVDFEGIQSQVINIESDNFLTSTRDINNAIKEAIQNDPRLSKLLTVSDLKNEGLQIDSNIHRAMTGTDGDVAGGDLKINFIAPTFGGTDNDNQDTNYANDDATLFAGRNSVSDNELTSAWQAYFPDSEGPTGSNTSAAGSLFDGDSSAADMHASIFGQFDYTNNASTATNPSVSFNGYNVEQTQNGKNSDEDTFNVINGGTGDDVIVLSSKEAGGFDTVVLDENFGTDTIMNFNTGTSGNAGTVADQIDFSNFLDLVAAGRGASTTADDRVDQRADITFVNGLATPANLTGAIDHNAVVMVGASNIYNDLGTTALPGTFDDLTVAQVQTALEANQGWVNETNAANDNLVGSSFVLRVARDVQIETDASGDNMAGNAVDAQREKVYTVTISGYDATEGYSFTATEQGALEYGDMFSTLASVRAESVTRTVDAAAEEATAKGELLPGAGGDTTIPAYTIDDAETAAANDTLEDIYNITDDLTTVLTKVSGSVVADKAVIAGAHQITLRDVNNETATFNHMDAASAADIIDFTVDNAATLTSNQFYQITGAGLELTDSDAITVTGASESIAGAIGGALGGASALEGDTIEFNDDLNNPVYFSAPQLKALQDKFVSFAADADGTGNDATVIVGLLNGQTISGTALEDTFRFASGDRDVTINHYVSADDTLDISTLGPLTQGGAAQTDLVTGDSVAQASVVAADWASDQTNENGLGVIRITDQAATDWTNVGTVIENALSIDGTATGNGTFLLLVDNGTDTRAYVYSDQNDGFAAADDLTQVVTVTGVQVDGFNAGDFFISSD